VPPSMKRPCTRGSTPSVAARYSERGKIGPSRTPLEHRQNTGSPRAMFATPSPMGSIASFRRAIASEISAIDGAIADLDATIDVIDGSIGAITSSIDEIASIDVCDRSVDRPARRGDRQNLPAGARPQLDEVGRRPGEVRLNRGVVDDPRASERAPCVAVEGRPAEPAPLFPDRPIPSSARRPQRGHRVHFKAYRPRATPRASSTLRRGWRSLA
jgi:hypothetical protein